MFTTARLLAASALSGLLLFSNTSASHSIPDPTDDNPVELGSVAWGRDHDAAFAESRESGRPVLLLFQEIPGCSTCKAFGRGPLSHPLIAEAIEREFVPLAIYNNRPGVDQKLLERYEEPAWNNPVVRHFTADGSELLPRADGVYDAGSVVERMIAALEKAGRPVPRYLALAHEELLAPRLERAVFGMHCFWKGEAELGGIDGVFRTRVGWLDEREVVEVFYDPKRLPFVELVRNANDAGCADVVFVGDGDRYESAREVLGGDVKLSVEALRAAKPSDEKYHLEHSNLRFVPLTPLQATRVNAWLERHEDPRPLLSPRQAELWKAIATLLADDPDALAKFQRPDSIDGLSAYTRRLESLLTAGV